MATSVATFAATTTQITKNGVTWNFSSAVEYGQFVNGDYWVVAPVTVSSVSPGWDGTRHGSMLDPDTTSGVQGYRTGIYYPFNSGVRVSFPLTVSSGIKSLVSTVGLTNIIQGGSASGVDRASVLTIVSSPPPSGSFRPPYTAGPKPIRNVSEVNYGLVPNLSLPSGATLPSLTNTLKEVWLQHGKVRGDYSSSFIPNSNVPGYSRDAAKQVSDISLAMMVDSTNRTEYINRLIQTGIDAYYVHLQNGDAWRAFGGFGNGRKWPILFAGILLNDDNYKNPISLVEAPLASSSLVDKFGEDGHTSYGQPSALYPGGRPIFGQDCVSGQYQNYLDGKGGAKDCRDPNGLNVNGGGGYRVCCTSHTWVGYALAARLMNAISLWGHNAFFDYVDWWVEVDTSDHSTFGTFPSTFVQKMWEEYRDGGPPPVAVAPTFSPAPGSYSSSQNVTITSATSGATIRYTTNGSTPTSSSGTVYSGPVSISVDTTLKAIAYKSGLTDSAVTIGSYLIGPPVAAPSFSPSPGGYGSAQSVTITTATSGATIRYTTDTSTPSASHGTIYSGAVSISSTTTLKAIAYKAGLLDSSVTTGLYSINVGGSVTAGAGQGFFNNSITEQGDEFTVTFTATPSASPTNAVIALSDGSASVYADLAAIARFNPSGYIDARSGANYIAANSIAYAAGVSYAFRLEVDITTGTYSIFVTPPGGAEQIVGVDYAFRSDQTGVTSLDNWTVQTDFTASGTSVTVEDFAIEAGGDTSAPSVPTGLAASSVTDTTVDLDWNVSTDNVGVAGYNIYTGGVSPVSVLENSVTLVGLMPDTTYAFSVSAYDAEGNESAQSSAVNVTTEESPGSGSLISEDFSSGASNFTVVSGGSWGVSSGRYVLSSPVDSGVNGLLGNISVHNTNVIGDFELSALVRITGTASTWNDAAVVFNYQNAANMYYVSLNESDDGNTKGVFKVVGGVPTELVNITSSIAADTDYVLEIIRSGTSIVVKLNGSEIASVSDATFSSGRVGFGSRNDGAQFDDLTVDSTAGDVTPPTAPANLAAGTITTTSVGLSWSASSDNVEVTGYKVYRNGSNPVSVGGTSTTVSGLTANTNYTFTVTAVDAAGNESPASAGVNVTTDGSPTTYDINASTDDRVVYDTGYLWDVTKDHHRVGRGDASGGKEYSVAIIPFQLPAVGTVTSASFKAYLYTLSGSPANNVDVYGLPYRSGSSVQSGDFYQGTYDGDSGATAIQDNYTTPSSSTGWAITSSAGDDNLVDYINAQISAGAEAGDWLFIRLSPDASNSSTKYHGFRSANYGTAADRPVLSVTILE